MIQLLQESSTNVTLYSSYVFGFRAPNGLFALRHPSNSGCPNMCIQFATRHYGYGISSTGNSGPIVILGLVAFLIHHVYRLAHDPLRRVPGPWLARFTRLWGLHQIRRGNFEQINVELHQRYGLSFPRPNPLLGWRGISKALSPGRYECDCAE